MRDERNELALQVQLQFKVSRVEGREGLGNWERGTGNRILSNMTNERRGRRVESREKGRTE